MPLDLSNIRVPFNRPHLTGIELDYIAEACHNGMLSGDGVFTKRCHKWLEEYSGAKKVLLSHSCTAALEMAAILLNLVPGDEVIMPSYTFVSTANAFVLRGATPVFVDIRSDTLNIDENLIEDAITPRTRAIVPVHYAGVSCEMDSILHVANKHKLDVVEDAAQGVMSSYKGRKLGSMGRFGAYSFHETKNIICGEGGALLINDVDSSKRAEVIREKGTDRSQFFRGEVNKYTWQDIGSSFLPGDLIAAFLFAQLNNAGGITSERMSAWNNYHSLLEPFELAGRIRRPFIPSECQHNAHMYYIILPKHINRDAVLDCFRAADIGALFHYVPLHTSPGGKKFGRAHGALPLTNEYSERLIRLPLWHGITYQMQQRVVDILKKYV